MTGQVIERAQWADAAASAEEWRGEFVGGPFGANLSVIFHHSDKVGAGPRLHRHPYPETFILRKGRALFTVGERQFEVQEGQIVVCPAHTPHKFENLGPGPLEQIDIHEAGTFRTEWLE
jgi:mannose-6-phosphate isomerase-like protein (cupin superfamily)